MKKNFKFFTIVIAVLLISTAVLTGSMFGIGSNNGEAKQYDLNVMADFAAENVAVNEEDAPTSQEALQKKFSSMSKVDKETNTITVITKEYLDKYWQANADKEPICTLTVEEVFYIIQDSINMYFSGGYSKVVFPAFGTDLRSEDSVKLPCEKEKVFSGAVEDKWENVNTVYEIILHRVRLLSSPEAFYETSYRGTLYIPTCTAIQSHYAEALSYFFDEPHNIMIDLERVPDVFIIHPGENLYITYAGDRFKPVYPTLEIVPMLPGAHRLTEEEQAIVYDTLIAGKEDWISDWDYENCEWRWSFSVTTPDGQYGNKYIRLELCECKVLHDKNMNRTRQLTDDEWQLIVEIFNKPSEGGRWF